ncbi:hypothetical protein FAIPA1_70173 [Frankia sp. AiPs1]
MLHMLSRFRGIGTAQASLDGRGAGLLLVDLRPAAGFIRWISLSVMALGDGGAADEQRCRFYRVFRPICPFVTP